MLTISAFGRALRRAKHTYYLRMALRDARKHATSAEAAYDEALMTAAFTGQPAVLKAAAVADHSEKDVPARLS